jgi:hypothetical protein
MVELEELSTDGTPINTEQTTPLRQELFADYNGIRPREFSSPFLNHDVIDEQPDAVDDDTNDDTFPKLTKTDSRTVNQYFSHLFKAAHRPSSSEERRLSMKDGHALEKLSLAPLEGVMILGGATKVKQWMALQSALKLRRSQVSLWSDLTYVMIGAQSTDLLKKPFSVDVSAMKHIATTIWTSPHVMSKATNGKTEEFARRVFAKLLLSALDPDFKASILSRIGETEGILANDGPFIYVLIVRELFPQESLFFIELRTHASNLESAKFKDFQTFLNTLRDYAMMLPGAENQAALLPVLLRSINEQDSPLLRSHFHSVATDHYVFQKTSKSIEDYISEASRILSLSSNQLLAFSATQLPPAPPAHSKRPTSDAGDLLSMAAATPDLQQVLRDQLLPLLAAPAYAGSGASDGKRSFNRYAHLPKPDWLTRHDTSTHKEFPRSDHSAKRAKTDKSTKPFNKTPKTPHAKVSENTLAAVLAQSLVGMLSK